MILLSRVEELIEELCPIGVEYQEIRKISAVLRGKRLTKNQLSETEKYPVFHGGLEPLGYFGLNNRNANTVMVINVGASAGSVGYSTVDFWSSDGCYCIEHSPLIIDRYMYYALLSNQNNLRSKVRYAGIPTLDAKAVEEIRIPLPPLEIQREIVRILDDFTELTAELIAELAAELTARKKQYEYHINALLSFEGNENTTYKNIGELASFRRGSFPQPYGNTEWYDGDGAMPFVQVADIGDDMRLVDNTKRKISTVAQPKSVYAPKGSIIISLQGSIGRIAITQYNAYIDRTVAIFQHISKELLPKYFVYQLQRIFAIKEKTARGSTIKTITKEEFTDFQIAIPPIKEQERIVVILDYLDILCNDLNNSLSAEIETRRKQYEYYRDKLLTFKELGAHNV